MLYRKSGPKDMWCMNTMRQLEIHELYGRSLTNVPLKRGGSMVVCF